MISLKVGLFRGSLSQHLRMSRAKGSGVFLGIWGLRSLYNTASDTFAPVIFLYGGYLEAISQRMIE